MNGWGVQAAGVAPGYAQVVARGPDMVGQSAMASGGVPPSDTLRQAAPAAGSEVRAAVTADLPRDNRSGMPVHGTDADHTADGDANRHSWHKLLDHLNHQLATTSFHVQFDTTAPANQIWLNVIDTATGQVIQKIPPDRVRAVLESAGAAGWAFDRRF